MNQRTCPRCLMQHSATARFCGRCGLELTRTRPGQANNADVGLFLHEEILLIALRDEKGTIESAASMSHPYAMAAAMLADLLLAGRVSIDEGRKKFVNVQSSEPVGDALMDECLSVMAGAKRRRKLNDWVGKFAHTRRLRHRAAERLCQRGILREREDKVLFVFPRKAYPTRDAGPEQRMLARLRDAIFADRTELDPRTIVLLSLAHGAGLLKIAFDKRALKERKARIERIINGELIGKATKEVIEAVTAAVVVACIMPSMMVAVTSG